MGQLSEQSPPQAIPVAGHGPRADGCSRPRPDQLPAPGLLLTLLVEAVLAGEPQSGAA